MKHLILTSIFALVIFGMSFAKDQVIVNPAYEFSKTGITHITKIELGKNETRLHVHTIFIPHWWVKFPQTTYIEDCATGKRWQATGIINGEFDKEIYMPDSGDSTFVLIFPPLDKSVVKINYCDTEEDDVTAILGISLDPKVKPHSGEIPGEVSQWIAAELGKAKRKTRMDFEAGEFFATDTARLIGYIKGYDLRAGFSTGVIYASNEITREDFPVVIQVHEDGRFEGVIPMNYPEYTFLFFERSMIYFYIQPGQTLAMMLDWEDFRMADRLRNERYTFKNIRYQGLTADINNELSAFHAQLPTSPARKIYDEMNGKTPDEFQSFLNECMAEYTRVYQGLLETEKLSEASKTILRNDYQITCANYLLDYEMSNRSKPTPFEFYDFLQDIPMNNKELLSTSDFSSFINRLEYCQPFMNARNQVYDALRPEKSYEQYLFEELNIPKTPEDEAYLLLDDSLLIKLNSPDIAQAVKEKLVEEYNSAGKEFSKRHGNNDEAYKKKYIDVIKPLSPGEIALEEWRLKDSVYINTLKLKPGIVYDVTKIRSLDFEFGKRLGNNKEEAWNFLTALNSDIPEPFLQKEADRLFLKNFPEEVRTAYELPDTYEANIFKELIAPFKGKVLLVDFWATTCGSCIANIKHHKAFREEYKDSPDAAFIFITTEELSPVNAYNKFVAEQELTHTYRLTADQYRYLRQLFRFNGIPRYVLVDREGRILNDNFSSHLQEEKLKEAISINE